MSKSHIFNLQFGVPEGPPEGNFGGLVSCNGGGVHQIFFTTLIMNLEWSKLKPENMSENCLPSFSPNLSYCLVFWDMPC